MHTKLTSKLRQADEVTDCVWSPSSFALPLRNPRCHPPPRLGWYQLPLTSNVAVANPIGKLSLQTAEVSVAHSTNEFEAAELISNGGLQAAIVVRHAPQKNVPMRCQTITVSQRHWMTANAPNQGKGPPPKTDVDGVDLTLAGTEPAVAPRMGDTGAFSQSRRNNTTPCI
jgi:hypothetical protein